MTVILGLNAYHADSAASIFVDGNLIAAAEEERFRRIKHWAGFPSLAIAYCLRQAQLQLSDVDCVALNSDPRAHLSKKIRFALQRRPAPGLVLDRLRNAKKRATIEEEFARSFPGQTLKATTLRVEHHLAHLASCFNASTFEQAVAVSIDGFGDFASAAWGMGTGTDLRVDGRVLFPHSLGIFYQAITQYLGFPNYGDEYKVMGLAPYGRPSFANALRRVAYPLVDGSFALDLQYFRHHREKVAYTWSDGEPKVGALFSETLSRLLGRPREPHEPLEARHRDIAHSLQLVYEEVMFEMLNALHKRYRVDALTVAGGCGANSVANGKIRLRTPFRELYVQAAAGDAGGAIGAGLIAASQLGQPPAHGQMSHAYWGPAFSDAELRQAISARDSDLQRAQCSVEHMPDESRLVARVAEHIAEGLVIGWFQGRMEWGPRALGNRSILCDPRRADMQQILNVKIKRRESFRPFAPSILREHVRDWFEQDEPVPFMMQVFQIRPEQRARIPAVTHVDGSGRLQTVTLEQNPRYYALIRAFAQRTDIPILLNTSFNENEPIVCQPSEALDCFLRTNMDVLVLGDHVLTRHAGNN
ncbi:MAG TPA: carbamoyltransferase C-terminal domain-containing protein [Polyangiales bacterium]|nr:carbamoyltransferase C-terminal domain-containing protein [Polyangiales bacterium]